MVQVTGTRIATRVKRQFGDESGVQVTNDDILMWLNDAMTEAAVQNNSINLKRTTLPAVAGEYMVEVPPIPVLSGIHTISYRSSVGGIYEPLTFVSANSFDELFPDWNAGTARGTPRFYTSADAGNFKVYPAPSATDGVAFIVLYNSFFAEYEDLNAVMDISPRYFQYLLEYCLMKAYEMDENWEAADRKAAFIQSTLNSLSSDDNNMNQQKYPVLSSLPEDM
jgi:hypothetical protein